MRPDAFQVCSVCFDGTAPCECACPHWLWRPSSAAVPSGPNRGAPPNCGGPRGERHRAYVGSYVQVSHQPEPHPSAMPGLWLYVAAGTNLFYDLRRVLEVNDACDLAAFVNASHSYDPGPHKGASTVNFRL